MLVDSMVCWQAIHRKEGAPEAAQNQNMNRTDARREPVELGAVQQSSTPAELQALIAADLARYGKIIREKGLKAE
jgi:tripartite-type tricarboxylate transporter receptor subunit TctC